MKRRKSKRTKPKRSTKKTKRLSRISRYSISSRIDAAAFWKALILFNLMISAFGFWLIYSQNNYILETIQSELPVAVAGDYKVTAVVVNPITGQFMMINSITVAGVFAGMMAFSVLYVFAKKNL